MSKPVFDKDRFEKCDPELGESTLPELAEDLVAQGLAVNKAVDGVVNTTPPQPFVTFDKAHAERVISNGNAYN